MEDAYTGKCFEISWTMMLSASRCIMPPVSLPGPQGIPGESQMSWRH
jgi:hypothetical protein